MLFERTVSRDRFLIIRTLLMTVGNATDMDSIRPTAPFKPKGKKSTRTPATEIVEGLPLPSLSEIKFVKNLPDALAPEFLLKTLRDDSLWPAQKVNRIRNRHMPGEFNLGTYASHFRTILWVEEHQTE